METPYRQPFIDAGRSRDISTSLEREMQAYAEKMRHAERLASLGMLSATLAHELTQPLTVVQMATQNALAALKTVDCPEPVVRDLLMSLKAFSQIEATLHRFRNFARKSLGAEKTEVNLDEAVSETVRLLQTAADKADVAIAVQGLDQLPTIWARRTDIEQLLFALAQNAIQAADRQRRHHLTISGLDAHGGIALRFEDDCGGIAPDDVPRVFDPFFTTKPIGEGTGLGLCIARSIAIEHSGRIDVQSTYGAGSVFTVTLPTETSNHEG